MADPRVLAGLVLIGLAAALAAVALLAVGLSRAGLARPGLVAGGLPLVLLPVAVAGAYGSWATTGLFSALAAAGGQARPVTEVVASVWTLPRAAWGASALASLLGLGIGLLRLGRRTDPPSCSPRRASLLIAMPLVALAVAAVSTLPLYQVLRVSSAIAVTDASDAARQERVEAVLHAYDLQAKGSGWLGGVVAFLVRRLTIGVFGGATAVLVLLGLALPGFILAWRVRFGGAFTVAASVTWLLAAVVGALAATGVVDPLRLP